MKVENLLMEGSGSRYREECKTESIPQFFPVSFYLLYIMGVPLFCPLIKCKGGTTSTKVFHVSYPRLPGMHRAAQTLVGGDKDFHDLNLRSFVLNHGYKAKAEFIA
jgi:hypothetical protein